MWPTTSTERGFGVVWTSWVVARRGRAWLWHSVVCVTVIDVGCDCVLLIGECR